MIKIRLLVPFAERKLRRDRHCDARIWICPTIVIVEFSNGFDLTLARHHPKAIELLETIRLPK